MKTKHLVVLSAFFLFSNYSAAEGISHYASPDDGILKFSDDGRAATIRVLAKNEHTHGHFSAMEHLMPAGYDGPGMHVHHKIVQSLYVVSGKVYVRLREGGQEREVLLTPGAFLAIAPGTPHTFRNPFDEDVKVLGIDGPGDLAPMFEEMAAIEPSATKEDRALKLFAIRKQKYDNHFEPTENRIPEDL